MARPSGARRSVCWLCVCVLAGLSGPAAPTFAQPPSDDPPTEDEPEAPEGAEEAEPPEAESDAPPEEPAQEPAEDEEDDGPLLLSDDDVLAPEPEDEGEGTSSGEGDVEFDELELSEEDMEIPDVVVTAARGDHDASTSVVQTEVIGRAEIERSGARDAAELLEERAGLQLTRSFRGTELWLRGLDPAYTLILVDGDRVPGRTGGAIDLSVYGVENIERIEIVRGPSSALYGSEAIGGVVNILTRDSNRDFEMDGLASYGLGNVIDATARVAGRPTEHLRFRLNGGFHFADPFGRPDDDPEANDEVTGGSSRLQWSLGGRAEWRPNRRHRLIAQGDYVSRDLQGVDPGAGGALFDRTQLQEQLQVSLTHQITGPNRIQLRTRASYGQFRAQYLLDQRGSNQLDQFEDNREHMGQISTVLTFGLPGNQALTMGFDQLFQVLDSERLTSIGRRARLAFFAQDEWVVFEEGAMNLTVVPGVRLDLDSQFGEQVSPKLAVRFDPVEQVAIRASYGRGFRAPSFQQLLLRFENPSVGYVVDGNPNLGAETSHGVDVGIEWRPDDWLQMSAAFFRNDVEEMIAVVTLEDGPGRGGTIFSYDNIQSAWTMGLETSAQLRIEEYLSLTAGYTLTETYEAENDRHLEGRARHRFTLSSRIAYEPWEISLVARGALLVDRVYYIDDDGDGIENEVWPDPVPQVDLRLSKTFTRHLELFVGIDNLIDAGDRFTILRPFTVYGGARGRY